MTPGLTNKGVRIKPVECPRQGHRWGIKHHCSAPSESLTGIQSPDSIINSFSNPTLTCPPFPPSTLPPWVWGLSQPAKNKQQAVREQHRVTRSRGGLASSEPMFSTAPWTREKGQCLLVIPVQTPLDFMIAYGHFWWARDEGTPSMDKGREWASQAGCKKGFFIESSEC